MIDGESPSFVVRTPYSCRISFVDDQGAQYTVVMRLGSSKNDQQSPVRNRAELPTTLNPPGRR